MGRGARPMRALLFGARAGALRTEAGGAVFSAIIS